MIEIRQLTKVFDKVTALDRLDLTVENGSVTGLIGSNGGGKSTLLRLLSGVYHPDGGEILIDGAAPFDNPAVKGSCCFVSDFPFYYSDSTLNNTAALYRNCRLAVIPDDLHCYDRHVDLMAEAIRSFLLDLKQK